ncbi:DNA repair protein RecO [Parvibium lacunae]|uniref:DNA repair protein RecO n=1 Tax=Parvibium lacunae TaxID=1888893 RepID=A0A368L7B1_9BURK|nr:DNA repair protein RecO [Parvibium lacunae]RCS59550.1 DNA repair protein RecO [Parvibium lacunae]
MKSHSAQPLRFLSLAESLNPPTPEAESGVIETPGKLQASTKTQGTRRLAPRSETRIEDETVVVLHSYPYSETSLILDVLSRQHGRVALIAKGAKRPRSALRGVLSSFQPLSLSWSGRGEVRTLTKAEWLGGFTPLWGDALLMGFYLNELLLKLLPRDDAHPELFDAYLATLGQLNNSQAATLALRRFERALLAELGYAIHYTEDIYGNAVQPHAAYRIDPEAGAIPLQSAESQGDALVVPGQVLLDLEHNHADTQDKLRTQQAKLVMRALINHLLAGQPLNTRQILIDLQKL